MLNEKQIQQYKNKGYVIVENFFDERELKAMQGELARFRKEGLGKDVNPQSGKVNYQVMPLYDKSRLFCSFLFQDKVRKALVQLLGTQNIYRWLDQIFLKPAKSGSGTEWHQDNEYFKAESPHHGIGMWTALNDASRANGTMEMIPRSENMNVSYERSQGSDHHMVARNVDESAKEYVEVKAGGCVFFNWGILHCTRANTTEDDRTGLAYHFVSEEGRNYQGINIIPEQIICVNGVEYSAGKNELGESYEGVWEEQTAQLSPN